MLNGLRYFIAHKFMNTIFCTSANEDLSKNDLILIENINKEDPFDQGK